MPYCPRCWRDNVQYLPADEKIDFAVIVQRGELSSGFVISAEEGNSITQVLHRDHQRMKGKLLPLRMLR